MTKKMPKNQSAHGLKPDCLSFGEVLAQSFAVIAPTTIPASNIGLIVALSGNGTWLSFLIGSIGLVFVSININQFASRSVSPGSLYSYIVIGKLRVRDVAFSAAAIAFMMIPIAGSAGIPGSTMFPPPEAPYDAFPYLFLMYLVATCGWFILQRLRSPELVGSMEQGIDAIHAKFEA